jgi:serine/threonine-protein kinase
VSDEIVKRAEGRVGSWLRQKWHLDELIGVGGMAAVYAATHRNGSRGAVKVLHLELSVDTESRERFLREGYAANKVGNAGAVSVLDDDVTDDGSVFLVMELLDGAPLVDVLRRQPGRVMPLFAALSVTEQLLGILESAHERGIVHRDVKPDNVFITREGRVKLLDFGVAQLREGQKSFRTQSGFALGTPAFMPPEQAAGKWKEVGPPSDLWAVGATLFTMLTDRTVHEAETVPLLMAAAMMLPAPAFASVKPGAPDDVCALVDRALAFAPKGRFQSAHEMRVAVKRAMERNPGLSLLGALAPPARHGELLEPDTADASTVPNHVHTPQVSPRAKGQESVGASFTSERRTGAPPTSRTWLVAAAGLAMIAGGAAAVAIFSGREGREVAPVERPAGASGSADAPTMPNPPMRNGLVVEPQTSLGAPTTATPTDSSQVTATARSSAKPPPKATAAGAATTAAAATATATTQPTARPSASTDPYAVRGK